MKTFFDTSALIKRYLYEAGSDTVDNLFKKAEVVYTSPVSLIESMSVIRRLLLEKIISKNEYNELKNIIKEEFEEFKIIPLDKELENIAIDIIHQYQLKTLDAIQLGAAQCYQNEINQFITADKKLKQAAISEGFQVIDPLDELT